MASVKCPKCKGTNIECIGGKTKTTLNLNPLHPFTLVNHKAKGKQDWFCKDCGHRWKMK